MKTTHDAVKSKSSGVTSKSSGVMWASAGVAVAAAVYLVAKRVGFDWAGFGLELRHVSLWHIAVGVALIYASIWMRLVRWSVFCSYEPAGAAAGTRVGGRGAGRVEAMSLMGPMSMGFTAVALFGRLADLVRPYLIARRIERTLSSQVAVYTIERMFDLGAAATVFSCALAFTPRGLEHRERFVRVGVGSLAGTLAIGLFAFAVRWKGDVVAAAARRLLGGLSEKLAAGVEEKILGFREGLRGIRSAGEFALVSALSLGMWAMIGASYWQTLHAFTGTPELGSLSFSRVMLLMAVSIGGSLVQLPVVGWFTQIALLAAAMHGFYGAPLEAATACGALVLLTTSLSILPAGLLYAWKDGVSLRAMAEESGAAGSVG